MITNNNDNNDNDGNDDGDGDKHYSICKRKSQSVYDRKID